MTNDNTPGHTYLHTISEFSLHKGVLTGPQLSAICKEHNITSLGITDYNSSGGNMNGVLNLYKELEKNGISLVIGAKFDIKNPTSNSFDKLCLYAKNEDGYKNLMKLSTVSTENDKDSSFLTRGELFSHAQDLMCVFPFYDGEVSRLLNSEDTYGVEILLDEYSDYFEENIYMELSRQAGKSKIDLELRRVAYNFDIPLLPGTETYFYSPKARCVLDAIVAVGEKRLLDKPHAPTLPEGSFSFQKREVLKESFKDIPEILENLDSFGEKCKVIPVDQNPTPPLFRFSQEKAVDLGVSLPQPNEKLSTENDKFLFEHITQENLKEHLLSIPKEKHAEYQSRLEMENSIISSMGFCGYFLIEEDIISLARKLEIPVGPGRGSSLGSLAAFCLRINSIDPLPHGLLFERFLNPERITMPDIDVDFCAERRQELLDAIIKRYGEDYVSQVSAFGVMKASSSVKAAGKLFGISQKNVEILSVLVRPYDTLEEASSNPAVAKLTPTGTYKKLWYYARMLENKKSHTTKHASALVISTSPISDNAPTFRGKSGESLTQYTGDDIESSGLIKLDMLGLKTLSLLERVLSLIEDSGEKRPDLSQVDLNDPNVYELIAKGETSGMFQIGDAGIQALVKSVAPENFNHLCQILALYRPGPMESGMVHDFVERRHGRAKTSYIFPELEEILKETYGVILYQEQVMEIVKKIGGFSLGQADSIRRGMGKKDSEYLEKLRDSFVSGATKNGYDEAKSREVFDLVEKFAGYGFNKSHSVGYAAITYWTALLKTFYPVEFMSALMTTENGNNKKVSKFIQDARNIDINIVPPSVNISDSDFSIKTLGDTKSIVFGLQSVKGVGVAVGNAISKARGDRPFTNVGDFLSRCHSVPLTKGALEALVLVGALDFSGHTRSTLMANIESLMNVKRSTGEAKDDRDFIRGNEVEFPRTTLLNMEMNLTGTYISGHPLDGYKDKIKSLDKTDLRDIDSISHGTKVLFVGMCELIEKVSKKGKPYSMLKLTDLHSSREFMINDSFKKKLSKFTLTKPLAVTGTSKLEEKGYLNFTLYDVKGIDVAARKGIDVQTRYQNSAPIAAPKTSDEITLLLQPQTKIDYEEATLLAMELIKASYASDMVAKDGIRFNIVSGKDRTSLKSTGETGAITREIMENLYEEFGFNAGTGKRIPKEGEVQEFFDFKTGVEMIKDGVLKEVGRNGGF